MLLRASPRRPIPVPQPPQERTQRTQRTPRVTRTSPPLTTKAHHPRLFIASTFIQLALNTMDDEGAGHEMVAGILVGIIGPLFAAALC